ncbi:mycofactocin biosynthesis peptidyl-dipeptidase MftE [Rhodococcus sp. HNM0569]|uniref:mycofactocin biosynthesis peptidyl-dipeptidase MftE n=1 Tax=Rhodococcus sp. HNM0569 TaxID=2716340 RepID=UPI00146B4B1B|nr:mycofactocin biosynthesis peptidyl-dipeptidase MftE [Rhodococcus sp. HNM0569]NLU81685.1 mycofactocin biosynthesis peptidyl-dipeptidase MftE [Rhodococcus sp. HNM0569]
MSRELAGHTWPELRDESPVLAVPVGALEQHGPHLPLDTDTVIADAVARSLDGVLVAPPISIGASGEHEGFAGTVSIGADVLERVLVEFGRSACRWAGRIVWINGHGGNAHAVVKATTLLRYEGRDVAWHPCAVPGGDAHAGRTETSLLLHLSPARVHLDRLEPGNTEPVETLMPRLRQGGMVAVSANGVLGDPRGASAEEGAHDFARMCDRAAAMLTRWTPGPQGRLT